MSIFDRIANTLGYMKTSVPRDLTPWQSRMADWARWEIPDGTLYDVQAAYYKKLTWIHIAVNIFAQSAAGNALNVLEEQGEELVDVPNHPFELLLKRPNPLQSRFEFLEATFAFWKITGNAYWYMNRGVGGAPTELWIIPPNLLQPVPDGRQYLKGYEYTVQGDKFLIPVEDVVHFKRFNPSNEFVGLSPLESAAVVSAGDLAMQKWNTNLFGKDNAKIPGAVAFADTYTDSDWAKLKDEIKSQWGGTNRTGPLLMQGIGPGGVQWIQMALSQRDMEFLSGRAFTKEELYALFAPGLSSMLDVNSTEANSRTGLTVFQSMTVWPALTAVAEKITNDVLPLYGPQLVAAFDDPRVEDREIQLAEQREYAKTHTINEIRKEKYGDDPLVDGRGELLPVELYRERRGAGADNPMTEADEEAPVDDMPEEMKSVTPDKQAIEKELSQWRAYARRRVKEGKSPVDGFVCNVIPEDERARICEALAGATKAADVALAFDTEYAGGDVVHVNQPDDLYSQLARYLDSNAMGGETKAMRIGMPDVVVQMPEIKQAAPPNVVVNVPQQLPPNVVVNVPQQPAPVVNVAAPEVKIENKVEVPEIQVLSPPSKVRVRRDGTGRISSLERD